VRRTRKNLLRDGEKYEEKFHRDGRKYEEEFAEGW
jgi:hypothetical protein